MINWTQTLSNAIVDIKELLSILEINNENLLKKIDNNSNFPLYIPKSFITRMEKGNPNDPLLKQVIPLLKERENVPGYVLDPLKELKIINKLGVLQKYSSRVLLIVTGRCGINCRYCFRRHFPYNHFALRPSYIENTMKLISSDKTINEIILSGGDPLILADSKLMKLIKYVASIPHINTLRIHTRLPIIIPERIQDNLINILIKTRLKIILVTHINHKNEIDHNVEIAMNKLKIAGVTLFNQSVLLKGINDNLHTLKELSYSLFNIGIIPYYIHFLDKVSGVAHFEVTERKAKILYKKLLCNLPGYLVPKLVKEIPNAKSKILI